MDATICTVLTPFHLRLAGLNYRLCSLLNDGHPFEWIVTWNPELFLSKGNRQRIIKLIRIRRKLPPIWPKNSQQEEAQEFVRQEFAAAADPGSVHDYLPARVIDGFTREDLLARFHELFGLDNIVAFKAEKFLASYLHAASLAAAVREVKTRFLIILDPDLYVVRPNWAAEIIARMKERDLAVFGVPWNPRWHQKQRRFPCTHLMVIDREKIPLEAETFYPDLLRVDTTKYAAKTIQKFLHLKATKGAPRGDVRRAGWNLIRRFPATIAEDRNQRRSIGQSRDTGQMINKLIEDRGLNFEAALPVFDPKIEGFAGNSVTAIQRAPLVEALFPPEMRYVPPKETFSRKGFLEFGYPNFRSLKWEEFLFEGTPFAFHMRGEMHRPKQLRLDPYPAWFGLNTILERLGLDPLPWPDPSPARAVETVAQPARSERAAETLDAIT